MAYYFSLISFFFSNAGVVKLNFNDRTCSRNALVIYSWTWPIRLIFHFILWTYTLWILKILLKAQAIYILVAVCIEFRRNSKPQPWWHFRQAIRLLRSTWKRKTFQPKSKVCKFLALTWRETDANLKSAFFVCKKGGW